MSGSKRRMSGDHNFSQTKMSDIELWIELELESVRLLMNLQVALAVVVALVKDNAQDS